MRTKNELYQEALRTVARRRQTARAKAEDALSLIHILYSGSSVKPN